MIRWAVRQPPQILLIAVSGSASVRRVSEQLRELQRDDDELRNRHELDQRELNQSLMDLYQARGNAPLKGCWPLLVAKGRRSLFAGDPRPLSRSSSSAWSASLRTRPADRGVRFAHRPERS